MIEVNMDYDDFTSPWSFVACHPQFALRLPVKRHDIAATRAIDAVVVRGAVQDRAALDKMLTETRAKVAAWNAAAKP